jgi:uncharacterized 2Fe-2S/4Fe-4S cluster protein (DUF4445 family)
LSSRAIEIRIAINLHVSGKQSAIRTDKMSSMSLSEMVQIQFQPVGKRVAMTKNMRLIEAVRVAGIDLASACGGEGNCGQCQIVILQGEVTSPTPDEEFILDDLERAGGLRLACCTKALSNLTIQIPRSSLVTGQRLQIESNLREITVDPLVRAYPLELQPANLSDVRSDPTRITDALCQDYELCDISASLEVIRILSPLLRQNEWRISLFVRQHEIVGAGLYGTHPYGFAVDLGTTKIAAYLLDLESGEVLSSRGAPNPQIGYGEDVISRLNHVHRTQEGGRVLAELVRHTLDELLGELVIEAGISLTQVVDACIVSNTAMIHLLLRLPIRQLATAPYVAAASSGLDVRATDLELEMAPGAYIYLPPTIGVFVGSDHIAMVLASDMDQSEKITLGVDIGTNTEISIRKPGLPFLTAASCASGPAFEGAHISDGMRAASGAIEKVRINGDHIELITIDDEPLVGLCGSGIIDLIAELHNSGLINDRGRFHHQGQNVRTNSKGAEFSLVSPEKSGTGREIIITQEDVNEIQLAKGAILAGLCILMELTGTAPEEVEEVIIAGAFGSFLNVKNAVVMGLFPELPNAHYRQVGNAAAIGAQWILKSSAARQRAEQIAKHIHYSELTTYPKFSRQFALGMLFPPVPPSQITNHSTQEK